MFASGIVSGGIGYLNRSPIRQHQMAGTAAWWPHLGLAILAAVLFLIARLRRRRSGADGLLLLAPLGASAWQRLRLTIRTAPLRAVLGVPAIAFLLYNTQRAGVQVLGGLDPNFTTNAWGGPSYLGAMACHYLDLALISFAAGWALHQLFVQQGHGPRR